MPAPSTIPVRAVCASAKFPRHARRATSATMRAPAIRPPVFARIRRDRGPLRAMTTMRAPRPTSASTASAPGRLRSSAPPRTSATTWVRAIRRRARARAPRRPEPTAATAMRARKVTSAKRGHAYEGPTWSVSVTSATWRARAIRPRAPVPARLCRGHHATMGNRVLRMIPAKPECVCLVRRRW